MQDKTLSFWLAALLTLPLLYTAQANAGNYKTCLKIQIKTVDSGKGIKNGPNAGGTEDYYVNANAGEEVIARGIRVLMSRGTWSKFYDTVPSTGCFNWSHSATSGFTLRAYMYAKDTAGNYLRLHDSPYSFTSYPGKTLYTNYTNITPTNGGTNTYIIGVNDQRWTAMATLAFGLYRFHPGLSNKAIHVGLDPDSCDAASAHYGNGESNGYITKGRHYLVLGNCALGGTAQTKRKFVVTHELGHALAALYYGSQAGAVDGPEPNVDDFSHPAQGKCDQGGDFYSIRSIEWNSVGFREGFAHFIAAAIWNNPSTEGAFSLFEVAQDLERYNYGLGTNSGGRLVNECGRPLTDAGTNEDWLRFFWDWYTNVSATCPQRPTPLDMMRLYARVRLNGGLTSTNYFDKMRAAAADLTQLPLCLRTDRFDEYAVYNGIAN